MHSKEKKILLGVSGVIIILIVLVVFSAQENPDELEVIFLNVGQGDGILIKTPSGHTIVIDGGPDRSMIAEIGRSLPFYERTIDLIILSHGDADHVTGLIELMKRYDIGRVLFTGVEGNDGTYRAWEEVINEKGIPFTIAEYGKTFSFGEVTAEVIFPFEDVSERKFEDINDSSIFLKVAFGETEFLFTGDAASVVEERILREGIDVEADVLKVGHHGSKYSSSKEFVEAVDPDIAVIQVGADNSFGHPSKEVLEILDAVGAEVLRNDLEGRITLVSDGREVRYED